MIASAAQALGQMFDRSFRGVLWLGIGCTFGLFVLLLLVLQWAVGNVPDFGYVWLHDAIKIIAGALLTVVFVFLGAPVAQLFASIFLDRVATAVERRYYPAIARGQGAGFGGGLAAGLAFTGISLVLNLSALPLHFALPLIGTIVVLMINGYLTGRTYFELAALRHIKAPEARALRRRHRLRLFLGGALISFLAMIPFVNFIVPVFHRAGVCGGDDDARVPKTGERMSMRKLGLLIATVLLAGCQTVNNTWSSIASPDAPAREQTSAPPPTPTPPVQTAMTVPTAPTTLKGQSGEALQALWGEPSLKRKDLGSELWQYAGKGCTVLVYLYPASNGVLTVNHAEAVPGGAGETAIADCAKAAGKPPIKPMS